MEEPDISGNKVGQETLDDVYMHKSLLTKYLSKHNYNSTKNLSEKTFSYLLLEVLNRRQIS